MTRIFSMTWLAFYIVFAQSCANAPQTADEHFLEIKDTLLLAVVGNFQHDYLYYGKVVDGVVGMRIHSFCETPIAEIWKLNHLVSFDKNTSINYSKINGLPVFIFGQPTSTLGSPSMSFEEIWRLVEYHGVDSLNVPPRTEYAPRILYRLDGLDGKIFNVIDTLESYVDTRILYDKILNYCGLPLCY